jgi:chromosome partitioning protein
VYDAVIDRVELDELAIETAVDGVTLIPSSIALAGAEVELTPLEQRERRLSALLDPLRQRYDYILIDCPPSLGLLTINALTAADSTLVPIQCEYFALEGVSELIATVQRVKESLNPRLVIEGVVPTMWDDRTNLSRQVLDEIRKHFGEKVFQNVVPRNVRLGEAPSFGKPIILYDVKSKGAEAYLGIARELLAREQALALSLAGGAA